jgi:hypothetical protein
MIFMYIYIYYPLNKCGRQKKKNYKELYFRMVGVLDYVILIVL